MDRIIFFDGVCNLCNNSVDFIINRDKKGVFRFVSFQSPLSSQLLAPYDFDATALHSLALLKYNKLYTSSNAALEIARDLNGLWPMLYVFKVVPRFIRDAVYSWISKNRYRWFGKRETCRIPNEEERTRFLNPV